jgi:tetratricopeptide (TPR) repeat protein
METNFVAAGVDFNRCIALSPDSFQGYFNRAKLETMQHDTNGARADFDRTLALKSDLPEAYCRRGFLKSASKDREGALADFNQAIRLQPDLAPAYGGRAEVEAASTNFDQALADFNQAMKLKPGAVNGYVGRARVERKLGELDAALADLNTAIGLKAEPGGYFTRGLVKAGQGDVEGACLDFNQAIALDPKNGWYYRARGFAYYNQRNFTNAVADFREACALDVTTRNYAHFGIWLARARLGERLEANQELQAYFEQRAAGKPDDWPAAIARFLTDHLPENDFLQAAHDLNVRTDAERHCEAYFYAGSKRMIEGDGKTAGQYFRQCLATGMKDFSEYSCALAQLKFEEAAR